jgi:hypothetical protein
MTISRRRFLQSATAAGIILAAAPPVLAQPTSPVVAAARAFLAGLEPDQSGRTIFAFGAATWQGWNYFGSGGLIKPGLRFEEMTGLQQDAGWSLLATVLSPSGLDKARRVMLLQDVLTEAGSPDRSSQRFSIALFGEPTDTGTFGLRFEGHHISHSWTIRDGLVVAVTPASFSANPNIVSAGSHAGLVALTEEEALARQLMAALSPASAAQARISDRAMRNIASLPGQEMAHLTPSGLALADMSGGETDLLWQLVETYAVAHLAPDLASRQRERIRSGDQASIHFGWTGGNAEGTAFGYRILGPTFVIELGSVDAAALHLHTIYHDRQTYLGNA